MKSMNERISARRKELGLTLDEVAAFVGVNKGTVSRWESGEIDNMRRDKIAKLADVLKVSPLFIMGMQDTTPAAPPSCPQKEGVRVPVFSSIVADVPLEDSEVIDYEEIDAELARTGDFFALLIRDESMQPVLFVDDIVIVRKQATAETGDIAVILIDGDAATVKKIHRNHGGLMLIGYNAAIYEPHFYTNDEIESLPVQILGKVIELRRKL